MSSDNSVEEVRDDIMELTMEAREKNPEFDGITNYPGLATLVLSLATVVTGVIAIPFWLVNKLYSNRVCSTVIAIPTTCIAMIVAVSMGDLVGSLNQEMQNLEGMEDPIFFGCKACGVAPIEMADRAEIQPGDSPGTCDHCGEVIMWDWQIEAEDNSERGGLSENE